MNFFLENSPYWYFQVHRWIVAPAFLVFSFSVVVFDDRRWHSRHVVFGGVFLLIPRWINTQGTRKWPLTLHWSNHSINQTCPWYAARGFRKTKEESSQRHRSLRPWNSWTTQYMAQKLLLKNGIFTKLWSLVNSKRFSTKNFSIFEHDYAGRLDVCDFTFMTFAVPSPQMRPQLRCNVEHFVALKEENPLKSVFGVVLRTKIIAMTKNQRHTVTGPLCRLNKVTWKTRSVIPYTMRRRLLTVPGWIC